MPDPQRGTDRLGRRAKRFLAPSQKDELWLQLVGGETTISEAAERLEVDRSTIMRIREVARQGALEALATSNPVPLQRPGCGAGRGQGGGRAVVGDGQGAGGQADAGGGRRAWG